VKLGEGESFGKVLESGKKFMRLCPCQEPPKIGDKMICLPPVWCLIFGLVSRRFDLSPKGSVS
jgi:hypothetical protein